MQVHPERPAWIDGVESQTVAYHGCSANAAASILSTKDLRPSRKPYDWLGEGFYLWDRGSARAWDWAQQRIPDEPAVVGAIVDLTDCLDLTDLHGTRLLRDILHEMEFTGLELPKNDGKLHELDYFLITQACERLEDAGFLFSSVRGAFIEGDPIFQREDNASLLHEETHIQIAIRDRSCVQHLWLQRG